MNKHMKIQFNEIWKIKTKWITNRIMFLYLSFYVNLTLFLKLFCSIRTPWICLFHVQIGIGMSVTMCDDTFPKGDSHVF